MNPRPHARSTKLIESCALSFNVEVRPFDRDKWSAGLTMAKALDCMVDDDHDYRTDEAAKRLLSGETIDYLDDEEAEFVRSTYQQLNEVSQQRWRRSASELGAYALKRLEAEDNERYLDVASQESQLMGDVLLVENDDQRQDYTEREQFNIWMGQMARTAYMLDTLSDLIRDYNEGNMNIQPTPQVAAATARRALIELRHFAAVTPPAIYVAALHRAVTKSLEKAAMADFWTRQFIRKTLRQ